MSESPPSRRQPAERVFLRVPRNWDRLSPEEQYQVALEMARHMQRELGIRPNDQRHYPAGDTDD